MISVQIIRTGSVRVRSAQPRRQPGGLLRALVDREWCDWLPIYAWVIRHPSGIIVVDTGETARAMEPGYFPRWHPYYRRAVRMDVRPEEEIGPQLRELGIDPSSVRTVVMTHLHTDHAGGLGHFPSSEIRVNRPEWRTARGPAGQLLGYLPHRWPRWFAPVPIAFAKEPFGPFPSHARVTPEGDVVIVPTPGHTPAHVSVIVRTPEAHYFLAGDTTYSQALLLEGHPDGVSPRPSVTVATMERILRYAREVPTVYLPSHDPESASRLERAETLSVL